MKLIKIDQRKIKNFFYGPSFNIHKKNVKENDNVILILALSAIFSFVFGVVFKGGFKGFFKIVADSLANAIFLNEKTSIVISIICFILIFGSVILSIIGSILILKKKYVCFIDAFGLILFSFSLVYLYQATISFEVSKNNWFIYLIYILPLLVFLFASFILTFRFFAKLTIKNNLYSKIRTLDFEYKRKQEREVFKRAWLYLKKNYGQVLTIISLICLALSVLYPLVVLLMRSINNPIEDMKNPFAIPSVQSFDNYRVIWDYIKDAFVNSLVTTIGVTLGTIVCASLLAFAFIRFDFKGKSILYFGIIGLMMIPGILTLISRYQLVQKLGLIDDGYQDYITRLKIYGGIILPGIAGYIPMAFMLLFTFFKGIPHDLFEAADVDGTSNFGVFSKIVIPLSKPILSTIAIQTFVGEWNDYLWANLVHGNDGNSATLPVILQTLSRQAENGAMYYSVVFAGYVLSAIPLVLIFIVASKQFIEGLTSGAFKM